MLETLLSSRKNGSRFIKPQPGIALLGHRSHRSHGFLIALLGTALIFPLSAYGADWKGENGDGGDGIWQPSHFEGTSAPVNFIVTPTYHETEATVTVNSAVTGSYLLVRGGKEVTLDFQPGGSLELTGLISTGNGEEAPDASTNKLIMKGPSSGRAQVSTTRFYIDSPANIGTSHRSMVIVDGNIDLTLTSSFSSARTNTSFVFDGGMKLVSGGTTASSGTLYARSGNTLPGIYDNRISFLNADVEGIGFYARGLMQFGSDSTLKTSAISKAIDGNPSAATIYVADEMDAGNPGSMRGRLEVEGNGFATDIITNVYAGGTLAIGLSDADTMVRTQSANFTLNSVVNFIAPSAILELGIFGNEADQLIFNTGELVGEFILQLKIHGDSPTAGTSYTLFDIDPEAIANGTIQVNLDHLDRSIWDVSRFNQAGGWQVTAIPEPSSVFLGLAGLAMSGMILRKKRGHRRALDQG